MNYELNYFYLKEIKELMIGLAKRGIEFNFTKAFDGFKVDVPSQDWDAICHSGSYGCKSALLEVMGSKINKNPYNPVEGFLTAEEILKRVDEMKGE